MRDKTVKTEDNKWVIELECDKVGDSVSIGDIERQRDYDSIDNETYTFYEVSLNGEFLGTVDTLEEAKNVARDNAFEALKSAGFS